MSMAGPVKQQRLQDVERIIGGLLQLDFRQ
jgi:hypothetical protein